MPTLSTLRIPWIHQGWTPAKAEHCHLAYLTYMQNTSSEMPDRMKHKLDSRLQGKLSMTSDMQVTPPLGQNAKGS